MLVGAPQQAVGSQAGADAEHAAVSLAGHVPAGQAEPHCCWASRYCREEQVTVDLILGWWVCNPFDRKIFVIQFNDGHQFGFLRYVIT